MDSDGLPWPILAARLLYELAVFSSGRHLPVGLAHFEDTPRLEGGQGVLFPTSFSLIGRSSRCWRNEQERRLPPFEIQNRIGI
jgi:hypothetical protein